MLDYPAYTKKVMKQANSKEHSLNGTPFKCVNSYTGTNIFGRISIIKKGEVLTSHKGILVYKNTPICLEHSPVAHRHFFIDSDKKGAKRGALINKINYELEKTKTFFYGERNKQWLSLRHN